MKEKFPKAKRDSWTNLEPFPAKSTRIKIKRSFSKKEFQKLSFGFTPESMDDHWFAYLENDTLYYHRSWTGKAVYKVKFVKNGNYYIPEDVRLNRCGIKSIAYFLPRWLHGKFLLFLIQAEILEQDDPLPFPIFIKKIYRFIFNKKTK